jgi:FAD/FMN-containing dehydrogenase
MVEQLERHASGHYIGECDLTTEARAERSFSPAAWTRLRELRRRYDPDALFGTAYLPAG